MPWHLTGNSRTDPSKDFVGTTDTEPLAIRTDNAERLRVDTNGNVGIGTTSPAYPLHLSAGKAFRIEGGTNAADARNYFSFGGYGTVGVDAPGVVNGRFVVQNSGFVGIGTNSPRSVVEAAVSAPQTLGPSLTVTNTGGGVNAAAAVDLNTFPPPASAAYNPSSRIEAVDDGNFANDIVFLSNTPGAPNNGLVERMRMASTGQVTISGDLIVTGNVGIDATDPSARLAVEGIGPDRGGPADAAGVIGRVRNLNGPPGSNYLTAGVHGINDEGYGVLGDSNTYYGVIGRTVNGYAGVYGGAQQGAGVIGYTNAGWAGIFFGDVQVTGNLHKAGGGFHIDHPLDPQNKYLNHSFVESPDMKNVYDGVAVLDDSGQAAVTLPDWFDTLNQDFRYQLTPIGAPAPQLHLAEEIAQRTFRIAGGSPRQRISWQVTGSRKDPWARANPLSVEEQKPAVERGHYLHPELFGEDQALNIMAARFPNVPRTGR